jgi:hypothetical protein
VRKGILGPFRALFRERGASALHRCHALSFTATLSKKAISLSSPLHYMAVYWTCLVIGMSPWFADLQGQVERDERRRGGQEGDNSVYFVSIGRFWRLIP